MPLILGLLAPPCKDPAEGSAKGSAIPVAVLAGDGGVEGGDEEEAARWRSVRDEVGLPAHLGGNSIDSGYFSGRFWARFWTNFEIAYLNSFE